MHFVTVASFRQLDKHKAQRIVHGLRCTENPALPAFLARDAWQLAANSFEASFANAAHKVQWRQQLDAAFDAAASQG